MFISSLFFYFLIFTNDINALKEKFCVNCRHFVRAGPFCEDKFGRCRLYPIKPEQVHEMNYLVSGKRKIEYRFCSFAREDDQSCGKSGKYYTEQIFVLPGKKFLQSKLCFIKNKLEINDNTEQFEQENIITVEEIK